MARGPGGKLSEFWRRRKVAAAEQRGDVIVGWADALKLILDLARDLIPDPEREISRDLLGLLAFAWAARAEPEAAFDPHALLREIRARAWLGYADTPALAAQIKADLPRSDTGRRMIAFFEELAAKRSTDLFLPVVSRIDAHQSRVAPPPIGALRLDGLSERYAGLSAAAFARAAFALTPQMSREQDMFLLAIILDGWDGPRIARGPEVLSGAAVQLRRLYEDPSAAPERVRADFPELGPTGEFAHELVEVAEEVSAKAPWLWLETLFIVENWITGPQWYDHAFEVEEITQEAWVAAQGG